MTAQLRGSELLQRVEALADIGGNENSGMFTRYGATKAIADIKKELGTAEDVDAETQDAIQQTLKNIIEKESSPRLKAMYSNF